MSTYLNIDHVGIEFPTEHGPLKVLDGVDLKVDKGQFISLIGHSGCGKSTVLNIVAGLLKATEGGVVLEEKEVSEPGPDRAVVFQNHSLLPWLSVYDNVRLAVDQVFKKTKGKLERHDWTLHNLELVHMSHALQRRPDEISGGMKQRVGIARALAMEPKVLLMDEPFGALDSLTRTHMQDSLMEIQTRLNNTVLMITHDVDEAVLLSDRIVMMTNGPAARVGRILDIDLPRPRHRLELAENPTFNHYRAEVVKFLHERHVSNEGASAPPEPAQPPRGEVLELRDWKEKQRPGSGRKIEKQKIALGFIPLADCAPLVVAKEKGLFAAQGLEVELSRESSWANIRDKVSVGMLDGAQMLAGMPLASGAGMSGGAPLITALSLGLNGNAITVSNDLYQRMEAASNEPLATPAACAEALKRVIEKGKARGDKPLAFAMVFPVSSHHYLLRYWMASAGIDPDRDVELTVVPPPQMVNYLRAGVISGYCVGEPWNTVAVDEGLGRILATSRELWNNHPEKVLGVTHNWALSNPNAHQALLRALIEAAAWTDTPDNHEELCAMLGQGRYVNAPADLLQRSFSGGQFSVFNGYAANFPWRSHALWFLSQMVRWGQLKQAQDLQAMAEFAYRPDLYREAAASVGLMTPACDYKAEGEHGEDYLEAASGMPLGADRFFDGRAFSPDNALGYVKGFSIHAPDLPLQAFAAMNPSWPDARKQELLCQEKQAALVSAP